MCTAVYGQHPTEERISDLTFSSWYIIFEEIGNASLGITPEETERFYHILWPHTQQTICSMVAKIAYFERDDRYNNLTSDDREAFRIYRINVSDTFIFIYGAYPRQTADILLKTLRAAAEVKKWVYQESAIYLFGTVAEQEIIDDDYLLPFIHTFLNEVDLEVDRRFTETGITFVGQLSGISSIMPTYLDPLLELCLKYINRYDLCQSVTMALRTLTREIRTTFRPLFKDVICKCMGVVLSPAKLDLHERCRSMSIVGFCLSFVTPISLLTSLLETVVAPLIKIVNNGLSKFTELTLEHKAQIALNLTLLSNFVNAYTTPISEQDSFCSHMDDNDVISLKIQHGTAVNLLADALCPILMDVCKQCPIQLTESAMEMFSRILTCLGIKFEPYLPQLLQSIQSISSETQIGRCMLGVVRNSCSDVLSVIVFQNKYPSNDQSVQIITQMFIEVVHRSMKRIDEYRKGQSLADRVNAECTKRMSVAERYTSYRDASLEFKEDILDFLEEFMALVDYALHERSQLLNLLEADTINWILNILLESVQLNEMFTVKKAAELFIELEFIKADRFQHVIAPASPYVIRVLIETALIKSSKQTMSDVITPVIAIAHRYPPVKFSQWLVTAIKELYSEGCLESLNELEMNRFVKVLTANMTKRLIGPDVRMKIYTTVEHTAALARGNAGAK
ncbi:hypothetical protein ACOME3_002374 [Neoechinorhynchus agilis]